MARIFVVEEWLRSWAVGDFTVIEAARDITDIDHLCDSLVKELKNATENDGLLVVCADWKPFGISRRYEQNGVRLLKHLRLTPELGDLRRMHAVVLSFEPVEELIRRAPGSLVLLSRGVTFLRLPEGLDHLKDQPFLGRRAEILADLRDSNLVAGVRADYHPDPMHRISNWWGVYQIWCARKESQADEVAPLALPTEISKRLRTLHNKHAMFVESARADVSAAVADSQVLCSLESALRRKSPRLVLIDDEASLGWLDILRTSCSSTRRLKHKDQTLESVIAPKVNDNIDEQWIRRNVIDESPDVVLLDLRLRGDREADAPVTETSGYEALRLIRKLDWGLPVILMTASNKYWTYQEMTRVGADGYWMKEGLGEHRPPVSAAIHYSKLLQLVLACVGDGVRDLRLFSNFFYQLKNGECLWWENVRWTTQAVPSDILDDPWKKDALLCTTTARERALSQFESALSLYRFYLQSNDLKSVFIAHTMPDEAEREQCAAIGLAAGKVIEEIHCFTTLRENGIDPDRRVVGKYRQDVMGSLLLKFRGCCAHVHSERERPTIDEIRDYLALVLAYISTRPKSQNYDSRKTAAQYLREDGFLLAKYKLICNRSNLWGKLRDTTLG